MASFYRFQVYCTTEGQHVQETVWREDGDVPATCPNNSAHAIDVNRTSIIDSFTSALPTDGDGNLKTANTGPKEPDGRVIVVEYPASLNRRTFFCGAGDDENPTPPATGQGDGAEIWVQFTRTDQTAQNPEVKEVTFQFNSPVELHDGEVHWKPVDHFDVWDRFDFIIQMPATQTTLDAQGQGNCNLIPLGPSMNLIVPAPMNGTHNVNFTQAVPVISDSQNGYWECDYDSPTIAVSLTPGQAKYHLFDFPVQGYVCRNMGMGSPRGVFEVDAYRSEWCHPNWVFKFRVTKKSPGIGTAGGHLLSFRRRTD